VDLLGDGGVVTQMVPLPGGHSGETFLASAAGERSVVRIYARRGATRGANASEIDAAVLRLVRGLLPVPEVLEVRRADDSAGTPGVLVTTLLPGTRLAEVLPDVEDRLAETIGVDLGRILGRLAQMPMLRAGMFLNGDLRIGPMPPGCEDLVSWVDAHCATGPLAQWSAHDRLALRDVADHADDLIQRSDRACLVHSDMNPKNLLVDPRTGQVTGLLDWEFAHAGSPFSDLGNLLRFDRRPAFADAVLGVYGDHVPDAPPDLLDR
jgi:aminoglycoside phosphotransferase (APT) family kinase protein